MQFLFLCTHNRCRSILSEAVFNHLAPPGLRAASAGSEPCGEVNAWALRTLREAGIATDGLYSKGLGAFEQDPPDVLITVCDQAASEACPLFLGPALKAHWGLADPSRLQGSEAEIEAAFRHTLAIIHRRIAALLAQPLATMDRDALQQHLAAVGAI